MASREEGERYPRTCSRGMRQVYASDPPSLSHAHSLSLTHTHTHTHTQHKSRPPTTTPVREQMQDSCIWRGREREGTTRDGHGVASNPRGLQGPPTHEETNTIRPAPRIATEEQRHHRQDKTRTTEAESRRGMRTSPVEQQGRGGLHTWNVSPSIASLLLVLEISCAQEISLSRLYSRKTRLTTGMEDTNSCVSQKSPSEMVVRDTYRGTRGHLDPFCVTGSQDNDRVIVL